MQIPNGYIYVIKTLSRADIDKRVEEQHHFTHALEKIKKPTTPAAMCLISCDGKTVDYVGLAINGRKISASQWLLSFQDLVPMYSLSLTFHELRTMLSAEINRAVSQTFDAGYCSVSSRDWLQVIEAIMTLRPEMASDLTALSQRLQDYLTEQAGSPGYALMTEEQDAINTALWIAGFDRSHELQTRVIVPSSPMPVVRVLDGVELREDAMIDFDKRMVSPLWHEVMQSQLGAVKFQNTDGGELTVINVNRTNVEKALGVDLVYISHEYQSFVMVQYKRMVKVRKRWEYRPDHQFREELERMVQREAETVNSLAPRQLHDYRLHQGPFYFKFCPTSASYDPYSQEPIKGMYIPLDYWQTLQACDDVRGPRGGVRITYENVGRYIATGDFVKLVQSGWIGSCRADFERIANLVLEGLGAQKSVLIALNREKAA